MIELTNDEGRTLLDYIQKLEDKVGDGNNRLYTLRIQHVVDKVIEQIR